MNAIGSTCPDPLLLRDVEIDGRRTDVRLVAGRVDAVARDLEAAGGATLDGRGGALLPGLHDHHVHLRALAAALVSVPCGPPDVRDENDLRGALRRASPHQGWIRGVGYHASVAGELDRDVLDRMRDDVAVRVQDRSGMRWYCNSRALQALGLGRVEPGSSHGHTGVLTRADELVAERTPRHVAPWSRVGQLLATHGVTGCTDATVTNGPEDLADLRTAQTRGELPQLLHVLGRPELSGYGRDHGVRTSVGPVKFVLDEHDLPAMDTLVTTVRDAHDDDRGVAIHAVTRATLALAVATLRVAGAHPDDRIEHASVCPPELGAALAELGVTVVTQPGFVAERGERYRTEVAPDDLRWLYPVGSLLTWGVAVAGSTDAPFTRPDPWAAVRAAHDRRAADGAPIGPEHGIDVRRALDLFLTPLDDPGGRPRTVAPGSPAELCLLDAPLDDSLVTPDAMQVRLTVVAGRVVTAKREPGLGVP